MVCNPNQQKPARPIVAGAQDERSTNDREEADEANQDEVILQRAVDVEIACVEHESDNANCDKEPPNQGDRKRAFVHGTEFLIRKNSNQRP